MPRNPNHTAQTVSPTPVELQILLCLCENPLHGYGIKQEVEERTNGEMRLGSGTLYEAIQRLEATGCISETAAPAGNASGRRRRRYYGLTQTGRRQLQDELARLERIVRFAHDRKLLPDVR